MLWAMPRIARPDGLGELLEKQLLVVSRGQLLSLGVTDNVMQYRVRAGGPWQALLPGVYLGVSGAPSLAQKEMAALLYAGPGSLITGPLALVEAIMDQGRKGVTVQRYKGLGEMNPEQLWETTLDPQARSLLQVKVSHADEANEIFSTLMGDEVEPRRDFIQTNALNVANLDI